MSLSHIHLWAVLFVLLGMAAIVGLALRDNLKRKTGSKKEFYVSPERKQAMIEAGIWDDPDLRRKYLKAYQEYDAAVAIPEETTPTANVYLRLDTPAPKKRGRPKGSKDKAKRKKKIKRKAR